MPYAHLCGATICLLEGNWQLAIVVTHLCSFSNSTNTERFASKLIGRLVAIPMCCDRNVLCPLIAAQISDTAGVNQ